MLGEFVYLTVRAHGRDNVNFDHFLSGLGSVRETVCLLG